MPSLEVVRVPTLARVSIYQISDSLAAIYIDERPCHARDQLILRIWITLRSAVRLIVEAASYS